METRSEVRPLDKRLSAVDALRGLAVLVLILGQTALPAVRSWPRSQVTELLAWQLSPSVWHGVTAYDLVLPAFLCVAGMALPISMSRRRDAGQTPRRIWQHIVLRTIGLFAVGLVCEGAFSADFDELRIVGFFQRIAVCYLAVSLLIALLTVRMQLIVLTGLITGYWALLGFVPVPGNAAGPYTFRGNLAAYVDGHWLPGTAYFGTWDPEGLLTTVPAIAVTLAGALLGRFLISSYRGEMDKALYLALAGLLAINASILWSWWLPYNRHLWTSSFVVLVVGGISLLGGLFYLLLDAWRARRRARFLRVLGCNALVIVVGTHLLPLEQISARILGGQVGKFLGNIEPSLHAAFQLLVIWLLAFWLYKKTVIVKL